MRVKLAASRGDGNKKPVCGESAAVLHEVDLTMSGPDSQSHRPRRVRDGPGSDARPWPTDAALIAASIADPHAFAVIFDRHWDRIRRFCHVRAGAGGEDIAAETFRVAFDRRGLFDGLQDDAGPWLYGIATNLLHKFFRSSARGGRAVARLTDGVPRDEIDDALRRMEAEQLGPALASALATLSASERDTLLLYAWEDLTYDEIARALGVAVGTVSSRMSRARAAMQNSLATTISSPKDPS